MTRLSRLSGWPGPQCLFPVMAGAMAVSTFVATRGQLAAAYPLWANVSAAWHESLWMTGAVAAAGAAGVDADGVAGTTVGVPAGTIVGAPPRGSDRRAPPASATSAAAESWRCDGSFAIPRAMT